MRRLLDGFCQFLVSSILVSTIGTSTPLDTLGPGQSIKDGETLVSNGEDFELGFFSPGSSSNRYLGIWYKKISTGTVVWVANREAPILDTSGVLNITDDGVLVLVNSSKMVVWSSAVETARTAKNPMAQLLESGNFILTDGNESDPENYLWQSFHFPGDTTLPGMKLGRNLATGQDWSLTSWKSLDNPAKGEYTLSFDPHGYPQYLLRKGNVTIHRPGCWNGIRFTGAPRMKPNPWYRHEFVINEREMSFSTELLNKSILTRMVVNASGLTGRLTWIDKTLGWSEFFHIGRDECDDYNSCGANAKCSVTELGMCDCLEGFEPKSPTAYSTYHDRSAGCFRTDPLGCDNGDGFVKHQRMKLPDTSGSWFNMSLTLKECKELCLKNCSCTAYANTDVRNGGSGCILWFGALLDMAVFPEQGQDLYIRMSASYIVLRLLSWFKQLEAILIVLETVCIAISIYEKNIKRKREAREKKRIGVIVCSILLIMGVLALGWVVYTRRRKLKTQEKIKVMLESDYNDKSQKENLELPIFDLTTILKATGQFSIDNKLGEGGFGPVYKGTMFDGQEIAVKRLSVNSGQGLEEFKTEVLLIAKLQHRNLVKLLGCCIQGDERMLIYEYMPNKSLNYFIFDPLRSKLLDWQKRIHIIDGIARGLLYLHQDSRLRIIHRDLKTSNVLLDDNMNPKISDFGMARIFGNEQIEANTNRVVGTYGYMSPEYAADGHYSPKSDVFSFGVIVLEIVSGSRNKGFFGHHYHHNLVGYAWRLWTEEKPLELIDKELGEPPQLYEIFRCIHIGLLCVQQEPEDRPNMSTVVLMLGGESSLPQPKQPGFFTGKSLMPETESSSSNYISNSTNEITVSELKPR